jgi:hypothetical protein
MQLFIDGESKDVPSSSYISVETMKAWVYIVECSDGSYYTGSTTALEQRICGS